MSPEPKQSHAPVIQDAAMCLKDMDIVISGVSGKFPKANSVNEYEANYRTGMDMIDHDDSSRFPAGLWGLQKSFGRIKTIDQFDNEFFGFGQEQSNNVDHQHRLSLEVVYESILDAGINPSELRGNKRIGLYVGIYTNDFRRALLEKADSNMDPTVLQGFGSTVSNYFRLLGPSMSFDAACSSSSLALDQAITSIRMGVIDRAIILAVNLPIDPIVNIAFNELKMTSDAGFSRVLDSRADGYVKSDAVVSIVIERRAFAKRCYASILGSSTNCDGFTSEGITYPSKIAQSNLMENVKQTTKVHTNLIEYFEMHGTGTLAGDPVELGALSSVYYPKYDSADGSPIKIRDKESRSIGPMLVGSSKSNMGHSEAASGLCAIVKCLMMLEYEIIYKSLHFEQPNGRAEALLDGRAIYTSEQRKLHSKLIPVNCFGIGGSNVHTILRANEKPAIGVDDMIEPLPRLVVMFGRGQSQLDSFFDRLLDQQNYQTRNCLTNDFLYLLDSINSAHIDRMMNYRGFIIVDRNMDGEDGKYKQVCRHIKQCELPRLGVVDDLNYKKVHIQEAEQRQLSMIFTGLGSDWPQMASGLQTYKPFWSTIERLGGLLKSSGLTTNLVDLVTKDTGKNQALAIVAYEIALINMLKDKAKLGGHVTKFAGHSIGEVTCFYARGLITELQTILIAYAIDKVLWDNKDIISGSMVAAMMTQDEAMQMIASEELKDCSTLAVSCINGPSSSTVSGNDEDMRRFCAILEQSGDSYKVVEDRIALHNSQIMSHEVKLKLLNTIQQVLSPSNLPRVSCAINSDQWAPSISKNSIKKQLGEMTVVEYIAESLCCQVDFLAALKYLKGDHIICEVGPSGLFGSQVASMKSYKTNADQDIHYAPHYVKMMDKSTPVEAQTIKLVESIGQLYLAGAKLDLVEFNSSFVQSVRRQTPSLSSLIDWKHEQSFLVPLYPIYFSTNNYLSTLELTKVVNHQKQLLAHKIDGRAILPATAFVLLAWKTLSGAASDKQVQTQTQISGREFFLPCEIRDLSIYSPVPLDSDSLLDISINRATGAFQFVLDNQLVCDGSGRIITDQSPKLHSESLKKLIESENHELIVTKEDIYRQLRIRGYDYGKDFQLVQSTSRYRDHSLVEYKHDFISFADCVLQSCKHYNYASIGDFDLLVPTRIDFIRILPGQLMNKLSRFGLQIDPKSEELLEQEKSYKKYMSELSLVGFSDDKKELHDNLEKSTEDSCKYKPRQTSGKKNYEPQQGGDCDLKQDEKPKCLFHVYASSEANVVITEGLEIRGLKVTNMRRLFRELVFQVQKFTPVIEQPIDNPNMFCSMYTKLVKYSQVCNSIALYLIERIFNIEPNEFLKRITELVDSVDGRLLDVNECNRYKINNLSERAHQSMNKARGCQHVMDDAKSLTANYDIRKNKEMVLLSVFDCIQYYLDKNEIEDKIATLETTKFLLDHYFKELDRDLIKTYPSIDRIMRPMLELALDNIIDVKNFHFNVLEVSQGYHSIAGQLLQLAESSDKKIKTTWSIVHWDIEEFQKLPSVLKLSGKITDFLSSDSLTSSSSLDYHFVIYEDSSCYEFTRLQPIDLKSLAKKIKPGCFLFIKLRNKYSLAEALQLIMQQSDSSIMQADELFAKFKTINHDLVKRCERIEMQAEKIFCCLSKKSDHFGNLILMYRKIDNQAIRVTTSDFISLKEKMIIVRVKNDNFDSWMEQVRSNLHPIIQSLKADMGVTEDETGTSNDQKKFTQGTDEQIDQVDAGHEIPIKVVWLCSIATKGSKLSGLIGMFRTLVKEYGQAYLRCYHDEHNFKNRLEDPELDGEVSIDDIFDCKSFQESIHGDMLWNCYDSEGIRGEYRHFMANDYLQYKNCFTDVQAIELQPEVERLNACYADVSIKRDLSSFKWFELPYKFLDGDERNKMVKVCYSALNFRDVVVATGKVQAEITGKSSKIESIIGFEYSGIELATGKGVFGVASGCGISTHITPTKNRALQFDVPDSMEIAEAATIPVVYLTVIMGLIVRGKMKKGETILIHAASGAVGQAAINLCKHYGLTIYGTVGTNEKREFLLKEFGDCLSNSRLFSSRDCNFEHRIMAATKGRGVDLVLNSLADEKLQASIRCLADGGRFIEIGKYDFEMNNKFELQFMNTNKTFHGVSVDKMLGTDSIKVSKHCWAHIQILHKTFESLLRRRLLKPIARTVFERNQIEDAFRFMATGQHIGKVLIEINKPEDAIKGLTPKLMAEPRMHFSPQKAYVVNGGLGGMGIELCKWLAYKGVQYLVVTSRRGFSNQYQRSSFEMIEKLRDCKVLLVTKSMADTETRDGCMQLCKLALDFSPSKQIGGIFHLAAVLKDSLFDSLKPEDFEPVLKPKLDTGIYLDEVCDELKLDIDYFVYYSSVASGFGNVGQASYSYANSALERICEQRRSRGHHATAIQWGLIGDAGLAYEIFDEKKLAVVPLVPQRLASCMDVFSKLVASPFAIISSAVFKDVLIDSDTDIKTKVLSILGIKDISQLDENATLGSLGIDSLMAVEIMQFLEREKGKKIPPKDLREMKVGDLNDIDKAIEEYEKNKKFKK